MAMMDAGTRQREALPSISHLDLDKLRSDKVENPRFSGMSALNISTAPVESPSTIYSGPPPPYSYTASAAASNPGLTGYISPPDSTTRRSTRDEKESPGTRTSLPSIHEALGDQSIAFGSTHPSNNQTGSAPPTSVGQSFPDAPKGPSNPFSQPVPPPSLRDVSFQPTNPATDVSKPVASASNPNTRSGTFGYPVSPMTSAPPFRSNTLPNTTFGTQNEPLNRSPSQQEQTRPPPPFSYPQYGSQTTNGFSHVNEPYQFTAGPKPEDQRMSYPRSSTDNPYGETVKRHLEVFDAELGLNEIGEASARTLDFSRNWSQRYQSDRSGYFQDSLPGLHEIDDMLRQSHRVMENLNRIRDVVIAQQTALSEQRARLARGSHMEEEYATLPDEYKNGAFAGADTKKRRGKAAPPGRCHSCNRAETPEWRRGPDGARTLCNACGLHYAKLTRKMGVNKAAALTGSNLRPKNLES